MRTRNLLLLLLVLLFYPSFSRFLLEPEYRKLAEYNLTKLGYTKLRFINDVSIGCKDTPSHYWSVDFTGYRNLKQVFGTYCINTLGSDTSIRTR